MLVPPWRWGSRFALPIIQQSIGGLLRSLSNRRTVAGCHLELVVIASGVIYGLRPQRASTQKGSEAFWHRFGARKSVDRYSESPEPLSPTLYHGHLPVALYQSFDLIAYLPQTAGAVARVVEEGYGVSFFNPPPNKRYDPWLNPYAVRRYWAQHASDHWCRISRDIGIVAVVAPSSWTVRLPILYLERSSLYTQFHVLN